MAFNQPDKLMGGRVFVDHYTRLWAWECPCCGDNMKFPDTLHPRQDPKMEVCKILDRHLQQCQSMLAKFNNMNHQQILHQQQQQYLMMQAHALQQQGAMMSSSGVPGLSSNYGGLGGLSNGNWATNQAAPSGTNTLPSNSIAGAVNAVLTAANQRAFNSTREPLERTSTTFGEIVGWRMWTVRRGYLCAYSRDELWVPKEPMVGKPGDYDDVGIWAFKERKRAILKMLNDRCHSDRMTVCGSVLLYGTVIEHEQGYRAEYAMIRSLDDICGANADSDDPKEQAKMHKQFDKLKEKYLTKGNEDGKLTETAT